MGEITQDILNGLLCNVCGAYVDGEEPGHPRPCSDCKPAKKRSKKRKSSQPRKCAGCAKENPSFRNMALNNMNAERLGKSHADLCTDCSMVNEIGKRLPRGGRTE